MKQSLDMQMTPATLLKFAFPTMIANLFMSIYSTIDGIFVANFVNTNALTRAEGNAFEIPLFCRMGQSLSEAFGRQRAKMLV